MSVLFVIGVAAIVGCGAAPKPAGTPVGRHATGARFGSDCEGCAKTPPGRWRPDGAVDPGKPEYSCPSDGPVADVEISGDDIVDRIGNVLVVTAATGQYCCAVAPDCITGLHAWDVNPFCIGRMACRPVLYASDRK